MATIYLDYNATSPVLPEVLEAMLPFFATDFANPSSLHAPAGRARRALDRAREEVAALSGARTTEVIFTSGGTEANNAALAAALAAADASRREVLFSAVEHPAVREPLQALAARGYTVREAPVDREGRLNLAALEALVTERTALVAVMAANNETGVIQPVEEAGQIARAKGALFHVDAVQAAGKVPFDFGRLEADFAALSAHKLGGPKGAGAVLLRRGLPWRPSLLGGSQERGRRPGTENVPGIVGMGRAAALAAGRLAGYSARIAPLRDRLEAGLIERVPGAVANGRGAERVANTTNLSFAPAEGEALVLLLDREGICASTGSACSSGSGEPSPVLLAMGRSRSAARAAVRFSLGPETTDAELARVLEVLPRLVAQLKGLAGPTR